MWLQPQNHTHALSTPTSLQPNKRGIKTTVYDLVSLNVQNLSQKSPLGESSINKSLITVTYLPSDTKNVVRESLLTLWMEKRDI